MTKKDMDKLQREVRELFDELWQVPRFAGARRVLRPQVDCYHTDDPHQLIVVVELPGIEPQDVSILATERELLIAGERKRRRCAGQVFQQMEIDYGAFERTIPLIEEVDPSQATASYERGLLTIVLPAVTRRPAGAVNVEIHVTGAAEEAPVRKRP
jgi:HSP20 family protein